MCGHCTYEPLAVMRTTGPAYLDQDGAIVDSGEYVAALYESYAADHEWARGDTYLTRPESMPVDTWALLVRDSRDYTIVDYGESLASLGAYCRSAEGLAEQIWQRDVEWLAEFGSTMNYDEWVVDRDGTAEPYDL